MASLPCIKCDSRNAVEAYEDGDFCFSCHRKINNKRLRLEADEKKQKNPKKVQLTSLTEFWINWLKKRGINDKTTREFDIQYDQLSESIAYPVKKENKIIGYQLRDENKKIKTVKYVQDDEPFLFECNANNNAIVVIVENPASAMRIWQDAKLNAIALLGSNLNTANKLYLITKFQKVIVWLDKDLAGYDGAKKIVNDCSPFCDTRLIFTQKKHKNLSTEEIKNCIEWVI